MDTNKGRKRKAARQSVENSSPSGKNSQKKQKAPTNTKVEVMNGTVYFQFFKILVEDLFKDPVKFRFITNQNLKKAKLKLLRKIFENNGQKINDNIKCC